MTFNTINKSNNTISFLGKAVLLVMLLACATMPATEAKKCEELCTYFTFPHTKGQCWFGWTWIGGCTAVTWPQFENERQEMEDCEGACVCNVFGWNCRYTCGECYNTKSESELEEEIEEESECADYEKYMAMSHEDKLSQLESDLCRGGPSVVTSNGQDLVTMLENAADLDGDGVMSCEEFNNANWDEIQLDPEHLCEHN